MNDAPHSALGNAVPSVIRRRVSLETFYEGVELFLLGGKLKTIAQLWVVPEPLVQRLIRTKEFTDVATAMRTQVRANEATALSRLIHQSLATVATRLDDGDPYVDRFGEVRFKPITAKDAATIAALLYDRREKVERVQDGSGVLDDDTAHLISVAAALDSFRRKREEKQALEFTDAVVNEVEDDGGQRDAA